MDRNTILKSILCAAALTLTLTLVSCTQDDLFSAGEDALPEGMYPLQIGSISVSAGGDGQPWGADEPQTRVSENSDGSGSLFTNGDVIGVSLNGNTATYTYDGNKWTSDDPLYWKDTNKGTVTAWYPVAAEIDFTRQDENGLTYLLKATTDNADYKTAASLTFSHQLAKVRVVLTGTKASEVADVKIRSYPTAKNTQGTQSGNGSSPAYYPMRKATYDGTTCWEANMIPGTLIANNSFQISKSGGTPVTVKLDNDVPITAGNMHTITIAVEPSVEELKTTFYNAFFNNGNTSSPKGKQSGSYYILYATGTTIQKLINDILKTSINVPFDAKTITAPWGDSIYLVYDDTLRYMTITVGTIKFYVYIDTNQDPGYPELTL